MKLYFILGLMLFFGCDMPNMGDDLPQNNKCEIFIIPFTGEKNSLKYGKIMVKNDGIVHEINSDLVNKTQPIEDPFKCELGYKYLVICNGVLHKSYTISKDLNCVMTGKGMFKTNSKALKHIEQKKVKAEISEITFHSIKSAKMFVEQYDEYYLHRDFDSSFLWEDFDSITTLRIYEKKLKGIVFAEDYLEDKLKHISPKYIYIPSYSGPKRDSVDLKLYYKSLPINMGKVENVKLVSKKKIDTFNIVVFGAKPSELRKNLQNNGFTDFKLSYWKSL